ncbi:hypothetical protein BV20DRAFT_1000944 [Pilatotrama ljubarskyi]|nr:hypothetical protein BV20DRAFT_1000944 [Pilatotrama ljubarskyi]
MPDTLAYDADRLPQVAKLVPAVTCTLLVGLPWDSVNWSCAYDSALTILWNLFHDNSSDWFLTLAPGNEIMTFVRSTFATFSAPDVQLVAFREQFRDILYAAAPVRFPRYGQAVTAVADVLSVLFLSTVPFATSRCICRSCNTTTDVAIDACSSYVWSIPYTCWSAFYEGRTSISASEYVTALLDGCFTRPCSSCRKDTAICTMIFSLPPLIVIDAASGSVTPVTELPIIVAGHPHLMRLGGVIYHGSNHFTARFIDRSRSVWYHDGAASTANCVRERSLSHTDGLLMTTAEGRQACHYIYLPSHT